MSRSSLDSESDFSADCIRVHVQDSVTTCTVDIAILRLTIFLCIQIRVLLFCYILLSSCGRVRVSRDP